MAHGKSKELSLINKDPIVSVLSYATQGMTLVRDHRDRLDAHQIR
jgi:hypothetical protein